MFDKKLFKKRVIIFVVVYAALLSSLFLYKTFAKYVSNSNADVTGIIAKPIIVYEGLSDDNSSSLSLMLDDIDPASEDQIYTFEILNTNENVVTEVSLDYELEISTTNNLPLDITVIGNNNTTTINSSTNGQILTNSLYGSFNHSEVITHSYTIAISWQENMSDDIYASLIDNIMINVTWVQQE